MNSSQDEEATQGPRPPGPQSRRLVALVMLVALVVVAHLPFLVVHFAELWQEPYYQHYPLVLGMVGFLLWRNSRASVPDRDDDDDAETALAGRDLMRVGGRSTWGFFILGSLSLVTLALGVLLRSPWLAAIACILALGGFACEVRGLKRITNVLGIWCLLWLLIPIPMGFDQNLVVWLQGLSSRMSSRILDVMGWLHSMEGNVLVFPGKEFFVDEACSGIMSLMAMVAASAVVVVYRNRSLLHAVLVIASGLAWAAVMNSLRIVLIVACYYQFDLDLTTGWQHEVTGLILFGLGFCAVLSTDRLVEFVMDPVPGTGRSANPLLRSWGWLSGLGAPRVEDGGAPAAPVTIPLWFLGFTAVFLSLGALQLGILLGWGPFEAGGTERRVNGVADVEALLPREGLVAGRTRWALEGYRVDRRDRISVLGENSQIWTFDALGRTIEASVDYPFAKWHHLLMCYQGRGWDVINQEELRDEGWGVIRADLAQPSGERAMVIYACFRASGELMSPPERSLTGKLKARFVQPASGRLTGEPVYQFQMFIPNSAGLSADEKREIWEEFRLLRDQAWRKITSTSGEGNHASN